MTISDYEIAKEKLHSRFVCQVDLADTILIDLDPLEIHYQKSLQIFFFIELFLLMIN